MTDKGRAGPVEKTWGVAWRGSSGPSPGGLVASELRGERRAGRGRPWAGAGSASLQFPYFVNSECGQVRASWLCSYTLEPERLLLCVPYWESL